MDPEETTIVTHWTLKHYSIPYRHIRKPECLGIRKWAWLPDHRATPKRRWRNATAQFVRDGRRFREFCQRRNIPQPAP